MNNDTTVSLTQAEWCRAQNGEEKEMRVSEAAYLGK